MKIRDTCMCAYLHTRKREVCYSNRVMYGEDFSQGFEQIKKKKREKNTYKNIYLYMGVLQTVLLPCAREHGERVFGRRSSVCTLYILYLTRVVVYTFRIRHTFLPNGTGYIRERSYVYIYMLYIYI